MCYLDHVSQKTDTWEIKPQQGSDYVIYKTERRLAIPLHNISCHHIQRTENTGLSYLDDVPPFHFDSF